MRSYNRAHELNAKNVECQEYLIPYSKGMGMNFFQMTVRDYAKLNELQYTFAGNVDIDKAEERANKYRSKGLDVIVEKRDMIKKIILEVKIQIKLY